MNTTQEPRISIRDDIAIDIGRVVLTDSDGEIVWEGTMREYDAIAKSMRWGRPS